MFFTSDCRQVRNLLWDLASGALTGSDCEHAEAHLARCAACRSEYESYRKTISLMSEYKRDAVPASRLGWRDVERRVASQGSGARSWAKRPVFQIAMGGGSLALATLFVMSVMQANMNPVVVNSPVQIAKVSPNDSVSAPGPVDFPVMAGMPALMEMPRVNDPSVTPIRSASPRAERALKRVSRIVRNNRTSSSEPQVVSNDASAVNVDGGSPVPRLSPQYVLASASSGNDDDQNRHYVMDVVSTSRSSGSDSAEESHPW
jgi:hypothetical protein